MRIVVFFIVISIVYSCKENATNNETRPTVKSNKEADSTSYFQVAAFIQKQIDEVNRTPYFIYKLTVVDAKKDSTAIDNARFNEIAKQFLQPDINDPSLKKYYTESIFFDETTKSFTLSYTTSNKELEVQNVDVLLEEDGKTVKRILIRKFKSLGDGSAIEQLSWKPNERLQVISRLSSPGTESSTQTVVVWNQN
jgi:hypothetical protein